ncbi:MAG: RNA polymerase sigma factor [Planctomycetota bacterium]
MTRAQAGDQEAFNMLVERWYDVVVAAAFAKLADIDSAKDCAQEAFLESAKMLSKLRDKSKFGQWLYGISRNKAIYLLQRQKLHAEALKGKADESRRLMPIPSPLEQIGKNERLSGIRRALNEIPEIYREVLTLKYVDGRSQADIGKLLDISTAAVDKRLMRAKDMLRESLQRWKIEG